MDAYKILGISKDATPDQIRRAYRKKAAKHHPDRGGDQWAFEQTKKAYEHLLGKEQPSKPKMAKPPKPTVPSVPPVPPKQGQPDIPDSFEFVPTPPDLTKRSPVKRRKSKNPILGIIGGGLMAMLVTPAILYLSNRSFSKADLNTAFKKLAEATEPESTPEPVQQIVRRPEPKRMPVLQNQPIQPISRPKLAPEAEGVPVEPEKTESVQLPEIVRPGATIVGVPTVVRNAASDLYVELTIFNDSDSEIRQLSIEINNPAIESPNAKKDGFPVTEPVLLVAPIKPNETREVSARVRTFHGLEKSFFSNPNRPMKIRLVGDVEESDLRMGLADFERPIVAGLARYQSVLNDLTKVQADESRPKMIQELKREIEKDISGLVFPVVNVSTTNRSGVYQIEIGECETVLGLMKLTAPKLVFEKLSASKAKQIDKTWKVSVSGKLQIREDLGKATENGLIIIKSSAYPFSVVVNNPKVQLIEPD